MVIKKNTITDAVFASFKKKTILTLDEKIVSGFSKNCIFKISIWHFNFPLIIKIT